MDGLYPSRKKNKSMGTNTNSSVPNIWFFLMEALCWALYKYSLQLVWLVFLLSFCAEFPKERHEQSLNPNLQKLASFLNSGWQEQFKAARRSWPNTANNVFYLSWWCCLHQQTLTPVFHWCSILCTCVMLLNVCLGTFILILFTWMAAFNQASKTLWV